MTARTANAIEVPLTIGVTIVISRTGVWQRVDVIFFAAALGSKQNSSRGRTGKYYSQRDSKIVQLPRVHVETLLRRSTSAQIQAKSFEEHCDVAR